MKKDGTAICDFVLPNGKVCGHRCKPRGIGAHKRTAHGIVERVVVVDAKNDLNTEVQLPKNQKTDLSGVHLSHLSDSSQNDLNTEVKNGGGDLSGHLNKTVLSELSGRMKKVGEYIKKDEKVISKEVLPINHKDNPYAKEVVLHCKCCGDGITLLNDPSYKADTHPIFRFHMIDSKIMCDKCVLELFTKKRDWDEGYFLSQLSKTYDIYGNSLNRIFVTTSCGEYIEFIRGKINEKKG